MADEESRQESLTIYLAKPDLNRPDDTIDGIDRLRAFPLEDDDGALGTLYVQPRYAKPPSWAPFFVPQVAPKDLGVVSSTSALLHVVVDGRAFLIAFGQGRHLMKPNCVEERFGLKVILNSIEESRIRSIDKHTLDTIGRHTRVQASREAAPAELGIDIERDLLNGITGRPTDVSLGKSLSGLDALHVLVRVDLGSLRSLLARYLAQFQLETYKTVFPWVDHITPIKDTLLREQLDDAMLAAVAAGNSDKCWLAVPEPIEWATIAGFRHGKGVKSPSHSDVELSGFLEDHKIAADTVTVDYLKNHKVIAVDGNDTVKYSWPAYKCVYCEIEHAGQTYLLSSGQWYKIASDFVAQVNAFYEKVPRFPLQLPEYDDDSEGAYSGRVAAASGGDYALMDCELISIGGGHSKMEFCDLFSRSQDLIHVKRYGGSGVLSHLFLQGVVAGQVFVSDAEFRRKVCDFLPPTHRLADTVPRPDTRLFRVVFAIISAESGAKLTLPFFSRLSLRHAYQALDGYGYQVALAKIPVNARRAKTKKFPARGRKS